MVGGNVSSVDELCSVFYHKIDFQMVTKKSLNQGFVLVEES